MAKGLKYVIFGGAFFSLVLAHGAFAQNSGGASCLVAPASLPDSAIQGFLSSPADLLSEFQTGGILMSNRVRALAGTDPAALTPIIALANQANPAQVAALGAGLARAAAACVPVRPDFAARIQEEVAATDNAALQTAFAGATPETETAALGAAGAAGATGASAIGSIGSAGGGVNATGNAPPAGAGGTASGNSTFSAGASSAYFSTAGAGSSTIIAVSVTTQ